LQLVEDTSLCETVDSIQLNAPLDFNRYRWNTGDTTASIWAKQSGTYTLEAAYLCDTLYDSIQVTFNPKPLPPIVSDTGFCVDDTVQLNAQGQNLLWYDSLQDQSPKTSAPRFYNSSVETKQFWVSQSINNCESDLAQFTVKTEKPTAVFLGSDTILCGEDSLQIGQTADISWKYLWNTGDTTSKINAKNSGIYWLQASNLCNTSSDTVEINFNPIPSPPQVQNLSYCDTVSLNTDSLKVSGQKLLWYKSASDSLGKTNAPIPQALEAGRYRFFVSQTINSCESEKATFELTILSKPKVDLISNQTLCEGESIQLDAYFPTATYQWSTGDTTASISTDSSGVYAVSLSNQCGTAQDSVQLDFENCETKIFIPNAFSPNGDGINDLFQAKGENFQLTQMLIYNRWGEQVYRSNTPYWDGRIKGKKAQQGVYFYLISYKDALEEQKQLKGTVSVIY
jgi:gliding motility-associated-like protein